MEKEKPTQCGIYKDDMKYVEALQDNLTTGRKVSQADAIKKIIADRKIYLNER